MRRTNSGVEMHRIEQAEQRALRVDVRDDGARRDRLAGRQRDAGGGAVGGIDPRDARRRSESRRRPAAPPPTARRTSAPVPPTTNQPLAIGCPSPAPSRSSCAGAAGRPRPEERSEHAAGRDRGAQRLALEPFAHEVGGRPSASSAASGRRRACPARGTSVRSFSSAISSAAPGLSMEGGADGADRAQHAADPRDAVRKRG